MKPTIKFTQLFINNAFVDAASGKTFETIDPATEEVICKVSDGYSAYRSFILATTADKR